MEKLFIKYFTDTIEEAEQQALLDWLGEDEENRRIFFEFKSIYESEKLFPKKETIDELWSNIEDEITIDNGTVKPAKRFYVKPWFKYVAVAVVVFFATSSVFMLHKHHAYSIIENAIGEVGISEDNNLTALTLIDGTSVKLKKGSIIKIEDDFNQKKREVSLNGEAFFEVAHNEKKPFVVKTENQDITVLGTSFNVKDYIGADLASISLVDGSVSIDSDNLDIILKPNQQVIMNKKDKTFTLYNVPKDLMQTFASRKYHFREKSLADILSDVEYLFSIKIEIRNSSLSEKKYTGSLSLNQDIETIIKTLNYKHDFSYEVDKSTQKIIIK